MKLLLFSLLVAAVSSFPGATKDWKNESSEEYAPGSIGDIIKQLKEVEHELTKNIVQDVEKAYVEKEALKEEAKQRAKDKVVDLGEKIKEGIDQFEALRDKAADAIEAERQKLVDEFKQKVKDNVKARKEEKQAAEQKYEKVTQAIKDRLQKLKAAKDAKKQEIKNYIAEIEKSIIDNRKARAEEKKQLHDEHKEQRKQALEKYKSQQESLEDEKEALSNQYKDLKKREQEFQDELKKTFGEQIKDDLRQALEENLQDELEKEVWYQGLRDLLRPSAIPVVPVPVPVVANTTSPTGSGPVVYPYPPTVVPVAKASLVDTLTGKSSWETVAWVLLALCIILALALVALILYQVMASKHNQNNYERLGGHNSGNPPTLVDDERMGLLAPKKTELGGQQPPLYTGDVGSKYAGPSAPSHVEQTQQF